MLVSGRRWVSPLLHLSAIRASSPSAPCPMRDETTAKRHSSATKQARDSKSPHASASAPEKKKERMTSSTMRPGGEFVHAATLKTCTPSFLVVAAMLAFTSDRSVALLPAFLPSPRGDVYTPSSIVRASCGRRRPAFTLLRMSPEDNLDESDGPEKNKLRSQNIAGSPKGKVKRSLLSNAQVSRRDAPSKFLSETRRMRRDSQLRERSSGQDDASDMEVLNKPIDPDSPATDKEAHKPGHTPGKAVLSLAATSLYVPHQPVAHEDEPWAAGSMQVVVCSGGHDGQVKLWRLQARARLLVGDEMCVQAPCLMPVGHIQLPAADSSVFSLAELQVPSTANPCQPAGATSDDRRAYAPMLLVGEGKSRQVSCWSLRVEGAMSAVPGAGGAAVAGEERASVSSPQTSGAREWGWQSSPDAHAFDGRDSAEEEEGEGDEEEEDEDDDDDEEDLPAVNADGSTSMRVEESELAKALDSGGWRVVGSELAPLPAAHTGWVRSIATDFFFKKKTADLAASIAGAALARADAGHAHVPYVYSVGCNFIKVWQLANSPAPTSPQQQQTKQPQQKDAQAGGGWTSDTGRGREDREGGGKEESKGEAAVQHGPQGVSLPDATSLQWMGDLEVHGDILCVGASSGRVVSGSVDGTLRMWDLRHPLGASDVSDSKTRRLLKAAHPQVIAAHGGRITALAVVALPRQGRREAEEQDGRREAEEQEETEAHVGEEELEERGHLIFTCGHDGFVRSWSIRSLDDTHAEAEEADAEGSADESRGGFHTLGAGGVFLTSQEHENISDSQSRAQRWRMELEGEVDVVLAMGLYADEDERLLCMAVSPPDTGKPILGNWGSTCGRYIYVGTSGGSIVAIDQEADAADKSLSVVQIGARVTVHRGGGKITALTTAVYPRAPARKVVVAATSVGRLFCWLPFV